MSSSIPLKPWAITSPTSTVCALSIAFCYSLQAIALHLDLWRILVADNGTLSSLSEMQTLLNQWQQTRNPRTCLHRRPIYLSLEETETALAHFFRRHWVIGKSHGI